MAERFPGGDDRIPVLLTPLEAVRLLRLDIATNGDGEVTIRAPADAIRSLRRLVTKGLLRPHRFTKSCTFSRDDVLRLIREVGDER